MTKMFSAEVIKISMRIILIKNNTRGIVRNSVR